MQNDGTAQHRSFDGGLAGREHFLVVRAPAALDLPAQVAALAGRYQAALETLGLAPETSVFRRLFLSDVLNQAAAVRGSALVDDATAVSIVQQAPLHGAKLELLAYHIAGPEPLVKKRLAPRHLLVGKGGQRHLWSTRLCSGDGETTVSSAAQTREIFADLVRMLGRQGASLRDHCVRTWIFMKDVDVFYKGMVDSRRALFEEQGLTTATHYLASTGIEGACAHRHDLVSMDAYSNLDLRPEQVAYLNDFDRLCPTKDYNVTFERGTRIAYADRAHHYISGTASIDSTGAVVHPGDVRRQAGRMLENVEALLRSGGAGLDDLMYLIVYLRDPADHAPVEAFLEARLPGLPLVLVQASVCRPAWLIEAEGIAVTGQREPSLPAF